MREGGGRWEGGGTSSQLQLTNKPSPENETQRQTPPPQHEQMLPVVPLLLSSSVSLPKRFARMFVAEDLRYLLQRCEIRGQLNPAT